MHEQGISPLSDEHLLKKDILKGTIDAPKVAQYPWSQESAQDIATLGGFDQDEQIMSF